MLREQLSEKATSVLRSYEEKEPALRTQRKGFQV